MPVCQGSRWRLLAANKRERAEGEHRKESSDCKTMEMESVKKQTNMADCIDNEDALIA